MPAQRRRAPLWIHQTDPNRVLCAVVLMPSMMKTLLVLAALVACSEAFGGGGKAAPKKVAKKVSPAKKPCLLYTSPSPRDGLLSRMPSSA